MQNSIVSVFYVKSKDSVELKNVFRFKKYQFNRFNKKYVMKFKKYRKLMDFKTRIIAQEIGF